MFCVWSAVCKFANSEYAVLNVSIVYMLSKQELVYVCMYVYY
jgi:hypothetical protein